ncbi:MAG: CoA-acylating methylmalonate-semialdehyde dehydrogenase [Clostridia bacterium]
MSTGQTGVELERLPHYIGGQFRLSAATQWAPLYNPATGDAVASVPMDDLAALEEAVQTARAAFPDWAATPIMERARVMFRFRDLLESARRELARCVTDEHGKVLDDAYAEVGRGIEVVELAASAPSVLKGEVVANIAHGVDVTAIRVPIGVVAGLTPFNFPAMIPLWMFPIALVAGNTFVLKPSDRTPRTALRLAELLSAAGLPPGALNVVHGGAQVAEGILAHPDIRAVSFVGSEPVARHVYQSAAAHGKRVQALGGAKNFHVVMPDVILTDAVRGLVNSGYGSAGERCLACSVVLAVGEVADPLVAALKEAGDRLRVGPGTEEGVEMGPLIRSEHRARVVGYIESGVREGARLVRDGRGDRFAAGGFFLGPTLFDDVRPDMTIAREEIFGPVLSVIRVPDLQTAVDLANRSAFGNTASIYTRSGHAARYFRDHIEAGMVGVNVGVAAPVAIFPFAGWKTSFYGDLHATGRDGYLFYTESKVVTTRWPDEMS